MSQFSIITPTYNNADNISNAIESIISQKFQDWQLIIVDDGSTDNTEATVGKYLKDRRINYYKQINKGVSKARNFGIEKATGSYITFLDGDDQVSENWLLDFNNLISKSSNIGYLSCGYIVNQKKILPKTDTNITPYKYSSLAGTFAVNSDVLREVGGYDTNLKQSENWELTARILEYCENHNLQILHTNACNFSYHHNPTTDQTKIRDLHRAEATFYLYNKYSKSGIFHYRKDDFLLSSGVNYVRAGKIKQSRKIFYEILFQKPSLQSLGRIIIFEIPFLRNRKWGRNL